jgi:hypothetical protein
LTTANIFGLIYQSSTQIDISAKGESSNEQCSTMFSSILKAAPYDIEVDSGGNCLTVSVQIAACPDRNRIVSVVCELTETDICAAPCWEFAFSIDVFALDDCIEPLSTQDRQIAFAYIPAEIRERVMVVVCQGLISLVKQANCALVYRVTKDRYPNEKSLKKHYLLTETLVNIGFSVLDEGTDPYNRRFWIMHRTN